MSGRFLYWWMTKADGDFQDPSVALVRGQPDLINTAQWHGAHAGHWATATWGKQTYKLGLWGGLSVFGLCLLECFLLFERFGRPQTRQHMFDLEQFVTSSHERIQQSVNITVFVNQHVKHLLSCIFYKFHTTFVKRLVSLLVKTGLIFLNTSKVSLILEDKFRCKLSYDCIPATAIRGGVRWTHYRWEWMDYMVLLNSATTFTRDSFN